VVYGAIEAHHGAIEVDHGRQGHHDRHLLTTEATPCVVACRASRKDRSRADRRRRSDDARRCRTHRRAPRPRDGERERRQEALEVFEKHKDEIALVLLDMAMPRMNGADCFRELRKHGSVPVLITSGYVDHTAAQELLRAGANGFLEKPYTAEQLGAEVERILGKR
jgi:CheY-like chemotaxis protein